MKKLLPFALAGLIASCSQEKAVQMSMTNVQLIKIDTVLRYPNSAEQILTWRSVDRIDYITYEPMGNYYTVGAKMTVMVKR